MPTKKKRVGFIPRIIVLEIINKLSIENNLSNSKIISILVEEALIQRGILDLKRQVNDFSRSKHVINNNQNLGFMLKSNSDNKNRKFMEKADSQSEEISNNYVDSEIYKKFLMFLQFQEKMKKNNNT